MIIAPPYVSSLCTISPCSPSTLSRISKPKASRSQSMAAAGSR
jgi:hypothetical protein